jgi:hypothetical protein
MDGKADSGNGGEIAEPLDQGSSFEERSCR